MNQAKLDEFINTDVYTAWYVAHGKEGVFQAFSKHWCGEEYSGPSEHEVLYYDIDFKT